MPLRSGSRFGKPATLNRTAARCRLRSLGAAGDAEAAEDTESRVPGRTLANRLGVCSSDAGPAALGEREVEPGRRLQARRAAWAPGPPRGLRSAGICPESRGAGAATPAARRAQDAAGLGPAFEAWKWSPPRCGFPFVCLGLVASLQKRDPFHGSVGAGGALSGSDAKPQRSARRKVGPPTALWLCCHPGAGRSTRGLPAPIPHPSQDVAVRTRDRGTGRRCTAALNVCQVFVDAPVGCSRARGCGLGARPGSRAPCRVLRLLPPCCRGMKTEAQRASDLGHFLLRTSDKAGIISKVF
nr:uncharacterized protein LOC127493574 [Oryctolagus cuniculus]